MKNFFENGKEGFSLIEVIVSLFIVSVALIGGMTLINTVMSSSSLSSSKLVAAGLAQEGIEIIKNIRDLSLSTDNWDSCYTTYVGTNDYTIQYNDTALRAFADTPLRYDSSTGLYGYDAGVDTPFNYKRKITLVKNPSGLDDSEIKVAVQITWQERNRSQTLTVEDRLWNWR